MGHLASGENFHGRISWGFYHSSFRRMVDRNLGIFFSWPLPYFGKFSGNSILLARNVVGSPKVWVRAGDGNPQLQSRMRLFSTPLVAPWSFFKNVWKWKRNEFFAAERVSKWTKKGRKTWHKYSYAVKMYVINTEFQNCQIAELRHSLRHTVQHGDRRVAVVNKQGCVMGHGSQKQKEKDCWWEQRI